MVRTAPAAAALLAALPSVSAWGMLGHETVAYIASNFVQPGTRQFFQSKLADTSPDYLASVSNWADDWKYTSEGAFSRNFHYIDAQDSPPHACNVDLTRDCAGDDCVVKAIGNYVSFGPAKEYAKMLTSVIIRPAVPWTAA